MLIMLYFDQLKWNSSERFGPLYFSLKYMITYQIAVLDQNFQIVWICTFAFVLFESGPKLKFSIWSKILESGPELIHTLFRTKTLELQMNFEFRKWCYYTGFKGKSKRNWRKSSYNQRRGAWWCSILQIRCCSIYLEPRTRTVCSSDCSWSWLQY